MADKGIRFEMAREDSRRMIHLVMGFIQRVDTLRRKATWTRRSSPAWSRSAASTT
jgi:hypothetical protein